MAHRLHLDRTTVLRANTAVGVGFVWAGLAMSVLAALAVDLYRWFE